MNRPAEQEATSADPRDSESEGLAATEESEAAERAPRPAVRRLWLVGTVTLLLGLFALTTDVLLRAPEYAVEARIEIPSSELDTAMETLRARTFLDGVLDQYPSIDDEPAPASAMTDPVRRWLLTHGVPVAGSMLSPRETLETAAANLSVGRPDSTDIVRVGTRAPEASMAAGLVNRLIEAYIDSLPDTGAENTPEPEPLDTAAIEQLLDDVGSRLATAAVDLEEKSERWNRIRELPSERVAAESESPALREQGLRLVELRRDLTQASTIYTPANQQVRRLQLDIEAIEAAMNAQVPSIRNDASEAYRDAVALEDSLRSEYESLRAELQAAQAVGEVAPAVTAGPKARVIQAATPEVAALGFSSLESFGGGALGGLFLALTLVWVLEPNRRAARMAGAAALENRHGDAQVARSAVSENVQEIDNGRVSGSDTRDPREIELNRTGPGSQPTEAVRSLAADLLSARPEAGRVVTVSSVHPGEGKTTVACELGTVMARLGRKTLLIDGNLYLPRLEKIFGIERKRGLSGILSWTGRAEELAIEDQIQPTAVPGLHVLPAGLTPRDETGKVYPRAVSRRLRSNRLAELITRLRADFDVTLIDTPDLSANTVAWILGRQTDGIVLVFGPDQTQEAQDFARARLAETDTPVLGTIVNQPSRSPVPA